MKKQINDILNETNEKITSLTISFSQIDINAENSYSKIQEEYSRNLEELYKKRNSFIHNSQSMFLKYEDDDIEFIDNITAKFLLLLLNLDSMLKGYKDNTDTKLITAWHKLLDKKYHEHLFSFK